MCLSTADAFQSQGVVPENVHLHLFILLLLFLCLSLSRLGIFLYVSPELLQAGKVSSLTYITEMRVRMSLGTALEDSK